MAALSLTVGCGGEHSSEDSTTTTDTAQTSTATDQSASTADTSMGADRDFMMEAAMGGMMEVEAGKIASTNGASAQVKEFGKMMVDDHSKANEELKSIASELNVTLPTTLSEDMQKHMDEMRKMKGADFDKHYVDMMTEDHDKDVSKFEDQASNAKNDKVKAFAAKTLPVLKKHQEKIKAIKDGMKS